MDFYEREDAEKCQNSALAPIRITVRLFATLRDGRFSSDARDVSRGATAGDVVRELGIRYEEAALILVNGRHGDLDTPLSEGDTLALFPPIGGG